MEIKILDKSEKELGASMIEYVLLIALISIVALVTITAVGQKVNYTATSIQYHLDPSGTSLPCVITILNPIC